MDSVAEAADRAGKVAGAAENGTKLARAMYPTTTSTRSDLAPKLLRRAEGLTERYVKPASTALNVLGAQAGYMADIQRGMPADEALVKHYGKAGAKALGAFAGGTMGAGLGTVVGSPVLGAIAGGAGAYLGEKAGDHAGDGLLTAYKSGKKAAKMTTAEAQQLLRSIQVMATDRYFIDQVAARQRLAGRGY